MHWCSDRFGVLTSVGCRSGLVSVWISMFLSGDVTRSTTSGLSGTAYDFGLQNNHRNLLKFHFVKMFASNNFSMKFVGKRFHLTLSLFCYDLFVVAICVVNHL